MHLVTNKTSTDGNPPDAVMEDAERRATDNFQGPQRMQAAQAYASAYGWNCVVTETADMRPAFGSCKTAVGGSGFVTVPVLYGTLGYYVTERIGLAVSGRYQFKHGPKSNGLGVGLRADILLTEPSETGFHAGLVAGVLIGRVQAKAPSVTAPAGLAPAVDVAGPYASSGPFGLQGGMRIGYRFTRNIGIVVTPLANVMMSNFLFNLDLTGGLQLAF